MKKLTQTNIRLLKKLLLIRKVEEKISNIYFTDKIKSPIHLSIGQEAASVVVCDLLTKNDVVFGTYRGHALYLAKNGNLNKMIAELFGKITGCARGKGGSMHLVDKKVNMMATSAIVASSIPEAVGYAFALKYEKKKEIVVCFFGDGATNQGVFHESLNYASLYKLPILFVCENNDLAIHSRVKDRSAQINLTEFAKVNKISSKSFYDYDYFTIQKKLKKIIFNMRNKNKPYFIEIKTNRHYSHVGPDTDWDLGYRNFNHEKKNINKDPINLIKKTLSKNQINKIQSHVNLTLKKAFEFAEKSKFPNKNEIKKNIFNE